MHSLLLSGAGGSSNWTPLMLPLIGIVAILYAYDVTMKWRSRRKLLHENQIADQLTSGFETPSEPDNTTT